MPTSSSPIWYSFIGILWTILIALALASLVVGTVVITHHIDSGLFYKLFQLLNLDFERNLPTWFSAALLTLNGLSLLLIAYYTKMLDHRYFAHWLILSLLFFGLSMDEFIQFHEQVIRPVRTLLDTDKFLYNAWIIPASIALIPMGLFYLPFVLKLPENIKKTFFIAGIMYVGAVIGIEALGGAYYSSILLSQNLKYDTTYLLLTHIEETLEMAGLILFLSGNLSFVGYIASLLKHEDTNIDTIPLILVSQPLLTPLLQRNKHQSADSHYVVEP